MVAQLLLALLWWFIIHLTRALPCRCPLADWPVWSYDLSLPLTNATSTGELSLFPLLRPALFKLLRVGKQRVFRKLRHQSLDNSLCPWAGRLRHSESYLLHQPIPNNTASPWNDVSDDILSSYWRNFPALPTADPHIPLTPIDAFNPFWHHLLWLAFIATFSWFDVTFLWFSLSFDSSLGFPGEGPSSSKAIQPPTPIFTPCFPAMRLRGDGGCGDDMLFNDDEFEIVSDPTLEVSHPDADGGWIPATTYRHLVTGHVVLWYGGDDYEGLTDPLTLHLDPGASTFNGSNGTLHTMEGELIEARLAFALVSTPEAELPDTPATIVPESPIIGLPATPSTVLPTGSSPDPNPRTDPFLPLPSPITLNIAQCPIDPTCPHWDGLHVKSHFRQYHANVLLDENVARAFGVSLCPLCHSYYSSSSLRAHTSRCNGVTQRANARRQRYRGGHGIGRRGHTTTASNAPVTTHAPARFTRPTPLFELTAPADTSPPVLSARPLAAPAHPWLCGQPSPPGRGGVITYSWAFMPLIRCALGMIDHGGGTQTSAGDATWARWVAAYAAAFNARAITAASLPFTHNGCYLHATIQARLLHGHVAGGQSAVDPALEGEFMHWCREVQSNWYPPAAPNSRSAAGAAPADPQPLTSPPTEPPFEPPVDDDPDPDPEPRLLPVDLAEHCVLWSNVPRSHYHHFVAACLPACRAFLDAHAAEDPSAIGRAIDKILLIPSRCLRRKRGGSRKSHASLRRSIVAFHRSQLPQSTSPTVPLQSTVADALPVSMTPETVPGSDPAPATPVTIPGSPLSDAPTTPETVSDSGSAPATPATIPASPLQDLDATVPHILDDDGSYRAVLLGSLDPTLTFSLSAPPSPTPAPTPLTTSPPASLSPDLFASSPSPVQGPDTPSPTPTPTPVSDLHSCDTAVLLSCCASSDDQPPSHPSAPVSDDAWQGRLKNAVPLYRAGHFRRGTQCLTSDGFCAPSIDSLTKLRAKQTDRSSPSPDFPASAPYITIDPDILYKLIRKSCDGRKGGASGWTSELLLPLLGDDTCRSAVVLLLELIANDLLDHHSCWLLCSSIMHALPKPNGDVRPLAIGEEFLRLAARYCLDLERASLPDVFERVQLAFAPGGCERALQTVQAAVETNPDHVVLHIDSSNAFNAVDRGQVLGSVFNDDRLSSLWRVFRFTYGAPSPLLVRDRGCVVDYYPSTNGVKQGDVLASLGYSCAFQPALLAAVDGLPNVTARAIMDDLTLCGPVDEVFTAYDRYVASARALSVEVNPSKTVVQIPRGDPSNEVLVAATLRRLKVVRGNWKLLGAQVGVDFAAMSEWVTAKLASQTPVLRAIADPQFPAAIALRIAKICALPVPTYLMRCLNQRATLPGLAAFDTLLGTALFDRLGLGTFRALPRSAALSLAQPGRNGGLGVRQLEQVAAAARWASAAAVAPDVEHFLEASDPDDPPPFVLDRASCYAVLARDGVAVAQTNTQPVAPDDSRGPADNSPLNRAPTHYHLPPSVNIVSTFYNSAPRIPELQRSFTKQCDDARLRAFRSSPECSGDDIIRLDSCKHVNPNSILSSSRALSFPDHVVAHLIRLFIGLAPAGDAPTACPLCDMLLVPTANNPNRAPQPWHALTCVNLRRGVITQRHNAAMNVLCKFARSHGVLCRLEPKDDSSLVPDGEFHLPRSTVLVDVSGTHPHCASYRVKAIRDPGSAVVGRETTKHTKYDAYATSARAGFVPFVLDTYGRLGKEALAFIDLIISESFHGVVSPYAMTRGEFLLELAAVWHKYNALAATHWQVRARSLWHRQHQTVYRAAPLLMVHHTPA